MVSELNPVSASRGSDEKFVRGRAGAEALRDGEAVAVRGAEFVDQPDHPVDRLHAAQCAVPLALAARDADPLVDVGLGRGRSFRLSGRAGQAVGRHSVRL